MGEPIREGSAEELLWKIFGTQTAMVWYCGNCGQPWDEGANFCTATEGCIGTSQGVGVMRTSPAPGARDEENTDG